MIISITGTPGTGKTTISNELRKRYDVIDLNDFVKKNGLLGKFDEGRDTHEVDIRKLKKMLALPKTGVVFCEGHLSHFLDCDIIVVLRCNPSVLFERLKERNYSESKITENVQAEVLDVILVESVDTGKTVVELDNTEGNTNTIITALEDVVAGNIEQYAPGTVNWEEEMVKWF